MRTPCFLVSALALAASVAACGPSATPEAQSPDAPAAEAKPAKQYDTARGGRLFDKWVKETKNKDFKADAKATAGVADGQGGPKGNGTLLLQDGTPLLNDAGHDYRLKNFFGWDLRGKAGMYGPERMNKAYALDADLLGWTGDVSAIADKLGRGEGGLPALASVLGRDDLEEIAAFIVAVRDGALPRADAILSLTSPAQKDYALKTGGDAERGKELFRRRCAGCHGDDGTKMLFDDEEFSLGSHARQKAYEDWFKILNGQPGTGMGRQVTGTTAAEQTQEILDLLTALCDRKAFPAGAAKGADVADGDPRCGKALR